MSKGIALLPVLVFLAALCLFAVKPVSAAGAAGIIGLVVYRKRKIHSLG